MAYAEKRGNLWRARWRAPDGTVPSMPGFTQCHVEKRNRVLRADAGLSGAAGGVFSGE